MPLTQKEMIEKLAREFKLPVARTGALVHRYFELVTAQLVDQPERVEIPALGVFAVQVRPEHQTLHPTTGQQVTIPHRRTVRYRSAAELRRKLNAPKDPTP